MNIEIIKYIQYNRRKMLDFLAALADFLYARNVARGVAMSHVVSTVGQVGC